MLEIYHPRHVAWGEDTDTVPAPRIYDVFRTIDDKKIRVLFVVPRDSKKSFPKLEIKCQGESLQTIVTDLNDPGQPSWGLQLVETPLPPKLIEYGDTIPCEFKWGDFHYHVNLPRNPFFYMDRPTTITLHTMQKDHPLEQIKDWCLYHYRVHGIAHIVLYDNNSSNVNELTRELYNLSPGLIIKIIEWNFPFRINVPFGFIAQFVALNHCYYALNDNSHYHLHFDIDEYLVNPTNKPLLEYLDSKPASSILNLQIPGYWKSTVYAKEATPEKNQLNRVFDFPYRNKVPEKSLPRFIYSYRENFRVIIMVNNICFPVGSLRSYFQQTIILKIVRKLYRVAKRIFMFFSNRGYPASLYYNHYRGLTTGWGPDKRTVQLLQKNRAKHNFPENRKGRVNPVKYDPALHEYDHDMIAALHVAQLSTTPDEKD